MERTYNLPTSGQDAVSSQVLLIYLDNNAVQQAIIYRSQLLLNFAVIQLSTFKASFQIQDTEILAAIVIEMCKLRNHTHILSLSSFWRSACVKLEQH